MRRSSRVAALVLTGLLSVLLTACGWISPRVDINGAVGLTVDTEGRPIAVVELCHGKVTEVSIAGPNRGEQQNVVYAELTTDPQTESFTLDVASPPSAWAGSALALPITDELHIVGARSGPEQELTQMDFVPTDLVELQPGTVQWSGSGEQERLRAEDFHRAVCDRAVNSDWLAAAQHGVSSASSSSVPTRWDIVSQLTSSPRGGP